MIALIATPDLGATLAFLASHPDLLDGPADRVLAEAVQACPGDRMLEVHWELLDDARTYGAEALAELEDPDHWYAGLEGNLTAIDLHQVERFDLWRRRLAGADRQEVLRFVPVAFVISGRWERRHVDAPTMRALVGDQLPHALTLLVRLGQLRPDLSDRTATMSRLLST